MMFRFRSLIAAVCLFGLLLVIPGCQKNPGNRDVNQIPDNLSTAALQTHARYIKAVNSGQQVIQRTQPKQPAERKPHQGETVDLKVVEKLLHRVRHEVGAECLWIRRAFTMPG